MNIWQFMNGSPFLTFLLAVIFTNGVIRTAMILRGSR